MRFDAVGLVAPPGNTVRNPLDPGPTIVTFITTPDVPEGMVQLPFVPVTWIEYVSPPLRGVLRGPTFGVPERVSMIRHGVIRVCDGVICAFVAPENATPPVPATTAIAAPIAAHRARHPNDRVRTPGGFAPANEQPSGSGRCRVVLILMSTVPSIADTIPAACTQ